MKDLTLEATELNSKVVKKKRKKKKERERAKEKERHNFERLDEKGAARGMKMRQCVCLYHMYMGFVREEGKELRNMKNADA